MPDTVHHLATRTPPVAARIAIAGAVLALAFLAALHVLSPEFAPSWRMVSEYANGDQAWALSAMFLAWAASSWALAAAVAREAGSRLARVGVAFLAVAGLGEALAAVFDINHPLHAVAAALGILGLPVAAMCIGIVLARRAANPGQRKMLLWLSNLTWISIVLMALSFAVLFRSLAAAGVDLSAQTGPLAVLPDGVIALTGWANRFLIVVYCLWAMVAARSVTPRG
jgi:hypothetical membrane protein